ncbi:MAG: glycosyltransferase family 9 protein [Verrucomicrobiota bacterium]|nr:glycosyltransferase family 9 protein [Verrucomicrobiota bacterium]
MKSALVIRGGALGDFILTLPAIDALRASFRVEILANRALAPLSHGEMFLDDPRLAPFFGSSPSLPEKWRSHFGQHDLVISYVHDPERIFERNVRACGVAQFLRAPAIIDDRGPHATEQLAAPLRELGIPIHNFSPHLAVARTSSFSIALHPGSGSPRKNWPIDSWLALTGRLLSRVLPITIIGGEADEKQTALFRDRFGDRVGYCCSLPLAELAMILADTILVGHDSGVSHYAAAVGARCIVLFGPTNPAVWAPRGKKVLRAAEGDLSRLDLATVSAALDQELMRIGIST